MRQTSGGSIGPILHAGALTVTLRYVYIIYSMGICIVSSNNCCRSYYISMSLK